VTADLPVATDRLVELADGVHVWIGSERGAGGANAGVVADTDGLTVVDTLMVRSQWEPFAAAVAELDAPVRRIVLTHGHIEQVGGTKAFPAAAIFASPMTSWALDQPLPIDAYRAFFTAYSDEFDDLAELGTRPVTHLITDAASLTPRLEVLPIAGHTDGDVVVLVADVDVCFLGGIGSFGTTPLAFQSDLAAWADVLAAVADLADILVPAQGPIGGRDETEILAAYLRACVAANGDPAAIPPGPWDDWPERDPRDAINVERAAALARGRRDELPPSMIRAMGLA
jgi:cyclase